MKKSLEKQIGGDHYAKMAIQPVDFIINNNIPFREGSAIKYIARHQSKGGADDIKKAIHFLEMILEDYATSEESTEDRTVKDSLTVAGKKTIREWLEGLPTPYRECALMEAEDNPLMPIDSLARSQHAGLCYAFEWHTSLPGERLWDHVAVCLRENKPLPDSKPFWEYLRTLAAKRLPEGWEVDPAADFNVENLHFDLITLKWINVKDHSEFALHNPLVAGRVVKESLIVDIAIRNLPEGYTFLGRGPFKLEPGRKWFRGRVWLKAAKIWASEIDIHPTNTQHIVCAKTKSVIALNKPKT